MLTSGTSPAAVLDSREADNKRLENGASVTNDGSAVRMDTKADKDGVPDASNNCPSAPNRAQHDANRDGVGDACEQAATFGLSPQNTPDQNRKALYDALAGSNNVVLPPGDYRVNNDPALGYIVLNNFSGSLTMHEGARFVFQHTRGRGFQLYSGTGAKFYNLTGTFPTLPPKRVVPQELFFFDRTTDTLVRDVDINGSASTGLFFGRGVRPVVNGGLIRNTRADGVHMANTQDARVVNLTTDTTGDDGISFVSYGGSRQGIGGYANNVTVRRGETRGITVIGSAEVLIENFRIEDTRTSGIMVAQESSYGTPVPYDVVARNGTIVNPGQYPGRGYPHGHGISLFHIGQGISFSDITITNPAAACTGGDELYYPATFERITCN